MSSTTVRPCCLAMSIAFRCARAAAASEKCVPVTSTARAHAEQHERREALRIDPHTACFDALARELLQHEPPHGLIAHAADQRRAQPEPRRANRDVGGASAHPLREAHDVLEAAADLLSVEIDAHAPDGDEIQVRSHVSGLPARQGPGCPTARISPGRSFYESDTPRSD